MKHVLLKTIVIVVGKLTRNRVLWGGVGFCRTPRGKKNFPIMQGGDEDSILRTHPTPLLSLVGMTVFH